MAMAVTIRRGTSDDAGAAADVWLRSRRAAVPSIPPPVHTDDDVRGWFAAVVVRERELWVAEAGGKVVGLMVLCDEEVDQLYLEPGWTGFGIGRELLDVAKRERPAGLRLWTFQSNLGARRFYERYGFVAIATTDGENEEGAPDVLYRWSPDASDDERVGQPG
jgi:GNAT superfamily N-acetyltransferase